LPHQVPEGFPIFLTWNLKGSLPLRVIDELRRERERLMGEPKKADESDAERKVRHGKLLFAKRDRSLDAACGETYVSLSRLTRDAKATGEQADRDVRLESLTYLEQLARDGRPMWLADPRAADEVVKSLLWGVPNRYALCAFAVLGNHVHVLLTPAADLDKVTQGIKGFTAFQINAIQNSRGRTFWQDESYDHWARDEDEMLRIIEYIENNPVAAGLCKRNEDWTWSSAFWRKELGWKYGEPFQAEWKKKVESTLGFLA
jgi:REP element-mobilizing transposase RayT